MKLRDRVKELRRVRASELKPHPKNWRTHPRFQQDVMREVLADVGMADALLVRELPDGSLQLVDGHLRAETTPSAIVPVLVLDLDDNETERVLLTHDPLASLATVDEPQLHELLSTHNTNEGALGELLGKLSQQLTDQELTIEPPDIEIPPLWQIVVELDGEQAQRELYDRLTGEGYTCRVLTL